MLEGHLEKMRVYGYDRIEFGKELYRSCQIYPDHFRRIAVAISISLSGRANTFSIVLALSPCIIEIPFWIGSVGRFRKLKKNDSNVCLSIQRWQDR